MCVCVVCACQVSGVCITRVCVCKGEGCVFHFLHFQKNEALARQQEEMDLCLQEIQELKKKGGVWPAMWPRVYTFGALSRGLYFWALLFPRSDP